MIGKISGIYFLFIVILLTQCTQSVKPVTTEPQKLPSGPFETFGPVVTFVDSSLSKLSLTYYTTKKVMDRVAVFGAVSNIIYDDKEPKNLHHFIIPADLETTVYRISSGDPLMNNRIGKITVPRRMPYRFAVYGDTRTGIDRHRKVCEAIAPYLPSFVINTGDLVEAGNDPALWTSFFRSAQPILETSAYVPAEGNHDGHNAIWETVFKLPYAIGYSYSYKLPGSKVIVLDTDIDFKPGSVQYTWLTNELAGSTVDWKIVAFHRPPYSSSYHSMDPETRTLQESLVPALEKYRVNLVLNGHDHLYERYEKSHVTYITTGGGGAPFYPLTGNNPYRIKAVVNELHFVLIDVTERRMLIKVLNESKKELDSFEIIE